MNSKKPVIGEAEPLQQVDRTFVLWRKRRLSYFSGCDYYRLASHPAVLEALVTGAQTCGLNVAASRATTGNHALYLELERQLGAFFKAESALVLPNGYVTGFVVAQALAGEFTHVLIDKRAHVCLRDSARFFGRPVLEFQHADPVDCARWLTKCGGKARPILLTDGMYSRDSSVAPLGEYLAALPGRGMILVDDAHAAGVIGANGRGSLEECGIGRDRIIQTITLSKAFGVYGGAVLGSRGLREKIVARSHLFVGATPLPLPLANAALASVRLLASEPVLRNRLRQNTRRVRSTLQKAGLAVPETPGPIICLPPMPKGRTTALRSALLRAGIYPPLIKYPGAPANGYFRFVISSEHTVAQLDNLASVLAAHARV